MINILSNSIKKLEQNIFQDYNSIEYLLKNQGFKTSLEKFSCGHKIPSKAKDCILSFLLNN